jgi:hypothetical protein
VILLVGIGYRRSKRRAYAVSGNHLRAPPIVHDHAEIPSTISLKRRPRWAEIRTFHLFLLMKDIKAMVGKA